MASMACMASMASWPRRQAMEDPKSPMARVLAADCAFCQGDAARAKADVRSRMGNIWYANYEDV